MTKSRRGVASKRPLVLNYRVIDSIINSAVGETPATCAIFEVTLTVSKIKPMEFTEPIVKGGGRVLATPGRVRLLLKIGKYRLC